MAEFGSIENPGGSGTAGKSAYELAVAAGFVGTQVEWLASLKGAKGDPALANLEEVNDLIEADREAHPFKVQEAADFTGFPSDTSVAYYALNKVTRFEVLFSDLPDVLVIPPGSTQNITYYGNGDYPNFAEPTTIVGNGPGGTVRKADFDFSTYGGCYAYFSAVSRAMASFGSLTLNIYGLQVSAYLNLQVAPSGPLNPFIDLSFAQKVYGQYPGRIDAGASKIGGVFGPGLSLEPENGLQTRNFDIPELLGRTSDNTAKLAKLANSAGASVDQGNLVNPDANSPRQWRTVRGSLNPIAIDMGFTRGVAHVVSLPGGYSQLKRLRAVVTAAGADIYGAPATVDPTTGHVSTYGSLWIIPGNQGLSAKTQDWNNGTDFDYRPNGMAVVLYLPNDGGSSASARIRTVAPHALDALTGLAYRTVSFTGVHPPSTILASSLSPQIATSIPLIGIEVAP